MGQNASLDEFVDADISSSTEPEDEESGKLLFGITSDQFVNEAIADLARQLDTLTDISVEIAPSTIRIPADQDTEPVSSAISDLVEESLSMVHSRTAAARQINGALEDMGHDSQDDRWVPPAGRPFPTKTGASRTIYEDDSVDAEALEAVGIDPEAVPATDSGERGLYALSPEFTGNSSSKHFPESQVPRYRRYFEAFESTLRGNNDPDDIVCMNCGRRDMPAYKDEDGEDLKYNQTFAILAATSGRSAIRGYSSRRNAHRGRCAACLVAGFYYSVMDKIIRPTGTSENDVRVFSPVGNLDRVANIRSDLDAIRQAKGYPRDPATDENYSGRNTLGDIYTDSAGIQTIEFYEQVYRHLNQSTEREGLETRIRRRPTALTTYISEVGRTRNIRNVESIDPESWAYESVRARTVNDDTFWPVSDVLSWFAQLNTGDENRHVTLQDDLAYGILEQSIERIERSVFEVTKLINRGEGVAPFTPHPGYRNHYFTDIMTQSATVPERIDDESIDSIRTVATSLGRVFHGDDDIGVLIKLQNASTPNTFLQAFEKAAMQAQKRSHSDAPTQWEVSRDDDVSRVLKLIGDQETFDVAKRMFVIHASLAAQYENVRQRDNSADSGDES